MNSLILMVETSLTSPSSWSPIMEIFINTTIVLSTSTSTSALISKVEMSDGNNVIYIPFCYLDENNASIPVASTSQDNALISVASTSQDNASISVALTGNSGNSQQFVFLFFRLFVLISCFLC